jgi:hypothetical protein
MAVLPQHCSFSPVWEEKTMRGLAVVAMLMGGLPLAVFIATLVLSDGAPLQSPFRWSSTGSGISATVHVTPDIKPGQPAPFTSADIATLIAVSQAQGWQPPRRQKLARDRTDAAWNRLHRMAAEGNHDALMFRTLMQAADFTRPPGRLNP